MDNNLLLTQTQAAKLRGVSRRTIYEWITKHGLFTVGIAGRIFIDKNDLMAFRPPKPGPKAKEQTK